MRKLVMGLAVSSMILTACNKAPEVSMTVPASANVGETVTMTNGSDVKKAYNVSWNFGDGGSANTWDATHVYDEAGSYTVTMTATTRKGNNSASATQVITVSDAGEAAVEDAQIAAAVANKAWWDKAAGDWTLTAGTIVYTDAESSNNNESYTANSKAKLTVFSIGMYNEDDWYTDGLGNKNDWGFSYVDDTHVRINSFPLFYDPTSGGSPNSYEWASSGVYEYTNTGSVITLKMTENDPTSWFDGDTKYGIDKTVTTITLTKKP